MRLKPIRIKKQRGFTLIEVLIYGGVFSLFLLLITQIFLTLRITAASALAMIDLQQNQVRMLADFNQTLRRAEAITYPSAGNSGGSLSLNDGALVYQVTGGVLEKKMGSTVLNLSDEGVKVTAVNFENVGEATQAGTIKIQMTLESSYLFQSGRTLTEEFQTSIGLR